MESFCLLCLQRSNYDFENRSKYDTFQKQLEFYHTRVLGLFKKLKSDKNEVDYSKFGVNETSVSASISITYIVNLFLTFYLS